MNALSISHLSFPENETVAVYDVDGFIRSWGRWGILSGGLLGVALGAIFISPPLNADTTFGIIGTLIVCGIECAVVAGGLATLAAMLYGRGTLLEFGSPLSIMSRFRGSPVSGHWPYGRVSETEGTAFDTRDFTLQEKP
jgi:hypothetical protein